ncbi:MAG: sulfatase-like hydrolase/transferase [Clostridia bacterium]|nr:sulfatase-like hydrolase/transferase [Clostridia bacterium]
MKARDKSQGRKFQFDKSNNKFFIALVVIAIALVLVQWIVGLNLITLINLIFLFIVSIIIFVNVVFKARLNKWLLLAYALPIFAIASFYIVAGADSGWGAYSTGKDGFVNLDHYLWQGEGNFFTRLVGNILIVSPCVALVLVLFVICKKLCDKKCVRPIASVLSVSLILASVALIFTCNLRAKPIAVDMSDGQDEYLKALNDYYKKNGVNSDSPNVLVILMDDMGYGDTSLNGNSVFTTPAMDYVGQEGVVFDNFYASYSVCSPSRFATLTGRYPYRGYADNVIYPTVTTSFPVCFTRLFNSFELGGNVDGMLGDEITLAEVFQSAGYATGAFGKWHLGDYGEYLPTNQGFDYFYGSHYVNDMTPFYYVEESDGRYEIVNGGTKIDQTMLTQYCHNSINEWITSVVNGSATRSADTYDKGTPFFAYYATPWPHAPIYAGRPTQRQEYKYDYATHKWQKTDKMVSVGQGSSGAGIYADCVTEFDYYLSELFYNMQELGVLDDTVIMFTSDNGPALQGSTDDLRGGKYTAYEGGQKVPCYIRYGNNEYMNSGTTVTAQATNVDFFPTLVELCGINGLVDGQTYENMMPFDRDIDGVSMNSLYIPDDHGEVAEYIHGQSRPILYMKREKIKSVSYAIPKSEALDMIVGSEVKIINSLGKTETYVVTEEMAESYDFIQSQPYTVWKYFKQMQNDNPAFPDKSRKNWLICLNDDWGENYQRADMFPLIAKDLKDTMTQWESKFAKNRRGLSQAYYSGGKKDYALYYTTVSAEKRN